MIVVRADGNQTIGMGHVMRCLAIAAALKNGGNQVLFITADTQPEAIIKAWGFECEVLDSDYTSMEQEIPVLQKLIIGINNLILVDSYYVTKHYFEQLHFFGKVVYIDDCMKEVYPVDSLINYNIYGESLPYRNNYPDTTELLLGSIYAPIRSEFKMSEYVLKHQVINVLITTGGGDSLHISKALASEILKDTEGDFSKVIFHIVCGPMNPDYELLAELADKTNHIQIHKNVSNMAELMKQCDIAISAAGSTLYELCALGIPTITFSFAENQVQCAVEFAARTFMVNAGNYAKDKEKVIGHIKRTLCRWIGDYPTRKLVASSMNLIVDGMGTKRIAEKLTTGGMK